MVSAVRTKKVVLPVGTVDPNSPGRGPAHCTCHAGGQTTPAMTAAQLVDAETARVSGAVGVDADLNGAPANVLVFGGGAMATRGGFDVIVAAIVVVIGGKHDSVRWQLAAFARTCSVSWAAANTPVLRSAVRMQSTTPRRRIALGTPDGARVRTKMTSPLMTRRRRARVRVRTCAFHRRLANPRRTHLARRLFGLRPSSMNRFLRASLERGVHSARATLRVNRRSCSGAVALSRRVALRTNARHQMGDL